MNIFAITFLLGISPSQNVDATTQHMWNSLNSSEQNILISHFEEEYQVKLSEIDHTTLTQLKRHDQLRSIDNCMRM